MSEEIKKAILEFMAKSSGKGKKKLYAKDITKELGNFDRNEVKKNIQELLDGDQLAYWSSGSTTYVMLKKDWDEIKAQESPG